MTIETISAIENLIGGGGGDAFTGDGAANALTGAGGADTLIGGANNDTLDGGQGADSLNGGTSNDVVMGSVWELTSDDRVTFGCRLGPIEGHPETAFSLVTGAEVAPERPFFGHKLTRDHALLHPWLQDFWDVIDFIYEQDHELHGFVG